MLPLPNFPVGPRFVVRKSRQKSENLDWRFPRKVEVKESPFALLCISHAVPKIPKDNKKSAMQ